MKRIDRRAAGAALALGVLALLAAPAGALTFLGLDTATGDVIQSVGFSIPTGPPPAPGGGAFDDVANELDISAAADNLDVEETCGSPPCNQRTLTEIAGGAIDAFLDLSSETLTFDGPPPFPFLPDPFTYTATFSGRGSDHIALYSPTSGPLPEQDGRLLVSGELTSVLTLIVDFTYNGSSVSVSSATIDGEFEVTGGDPTFLSAFGTTGNLGDLVALSTTYEQGGSAVSVNTLMSDGWLFSDRNNVLASCATDPGPYPATCTGATISGDTASFSFAGSGEVIPQNPSAFVPEPTTMLLLASGLAGLGVAGRRR